MAERGRGSSAPERTGFTTEREGMPEGSISTERQGRRFSIDPLRPVRHALSRIVRKTERIENAPNNLFDQIAYLQQIGLKTLDTEGYGLLAVGVGGSYNRNLGHNTRIESYDPETRTIKMSGIELVSPIRTEEKHKHKTRVDFDGIFVPVVREGEGLRMMTATELSAKMKRDEYEAKCKDLEKRLKRETLKIGGPSISIDPIFYHIPYTNLLTEVRGKIAHNTKVLNLFLSTIDVYPGNNGGSDRVLFSLPPAIQEVTAESIAPFAVESQTGTKAYFFSPTAEHLRYLVRGLSKKVKDNKKTGPGSPLYEVSQQFISMMQQADPSYYHANFASWEAFNSMLQGNKYATLAIRRPLYNLFWGTIGEFMAHNRATLKLKDWLT